MILRHLALAALTVAGLALAGCVSDQASHARTQVLVAPGVVFTLPPPDTLEHSVEALQLVTAHYAREAFVFETRISVTPKRLLAVGTDLLGRRAMTIEWTGDDLRAETAPWVPAMLPARNVIADIMLVHWPLDAVSNGLLPRGALQQTSPDHRVVAVAGRDLIAVDQVAGEPGSWSGQWSYRNLGWGYDLDIQSVESAP